jgi:multicomponent Na+:H+ antiporter subunit E
VFAAMIQSGQRDAASWRPSVLRSALVRGASLFAFWLIITGLRPTDLVTGLLAAVVATWASLSLLPPGQWRLHPVALVQLVLRFLQQSVLAGIDVARRALHPALPLRPGFIAYRPRLPSGMAQSAFCTIASLLPGTLPSGTEESGAVVVHCLDTSRPVATQLGEDEARFARVIGDTHHDD